jgi:glycine oxidase
LRRADATHHPLTEPISIVPNILMSSAGQIVVAGAGAVGTVCALVLARAGLDITVIDSTLVGANASAVAAGMLAPAFETLFDDAGTSRFELLAAARDLWAGLDARLSKDGALAVGTRDEAEAWAARLEAVGARTELLTPARTAALSADLALDAWSAFSPDDWRLDPSEALQGLRQAAEAAGARFLAGEVVGLSQGHVELADGRRLAADLLVAATGASRSLAELAPELAGLQPVKGHILRASGAWRAGPAIRKPGLYLCPGPGEIVVGATMEAGVADAAVDPDMAADLADRAARMAPGLAGLTWRAAAGVRAATPDGLPLLGASRTDGVILAVGMRRNGWLLAPLVAAEVLRCVDGSPPGAAAKLFAPRRFD